MELALFRRHKEIINLLQYLFFPHNSMLCLYILRFIHNLIYLRIINPMYLIKMFFLLSFKILLLMIMLTQMPSNFLIALDLLHESNMDIFISSQNFIWIFIFDNLFIAFIIIEFILITILFVKLSIL